ncbi:MAG: hypothetical protein KA257_09845, partial [Opitutaceae bacterium]|nr:hypothetical protein [Opitutaceae bacterium]
GPADQVLSSTPITLSASSSASLTVSFTLVSGPATLSGNSLTLTGEGTVVLQATQAGDSNRNAATPVNQSFVVTGLSFEAWQAVNFTSGELADTNISGANAIYGQDGLTNLLKYALGLDPKVNASAVTQITTNATDWVFTYQRPSAIADVSYEVEFSIDLSSWSTAGVTHSLLSSSGGVDTWTASYPLSSATRVFFRLVVTH